MECDLTVEELFKAYYDCRKTKRNTWNALRFEERLERNLMDLYHELVAGVYAPGRSMCFVVLYPKPREVWAADFRDRIVHHLLYNRVSARFYRRFIADTFACIPERGTLKAATRLEAFMRAASENYAKPTWFLKADIANFFVTIDKGVLDRLLARRITESWWINLCRIILHHDPTKDVHVRSSDALMARIPKHKSLFSSDSTTGLPIGNLSSQFFANVYLDPLDQFAKHRLKLRWYARYVDDIVALGESGEGLFSAYQALAEYAETELKIAFHPKKVSTNRIEAGVNFVGYIILPNRKYIRRSTLKSLRQKLRAKPLTSDADRLRATVNSYFGILRQANAFRARVELSRSLHAMGHKTDAAATKMIKAGKT
jgi:RNA-directed DNA polymerase